MELINDCPIIFRLSAMNVVLGPILYLFSKKLEYLISLDSSLSFFYPVTIRNDLSNEEFFCVYNTIMRILSFADIIFYLQICRFKGILMMEKNNSVTFPFVHFRFYMINKNIQEICKEIDFWNSLDWSKKVLFASTFTHVNSRPGDAPPVSRSTNEHNLRRGSNVNYLQLHRLGYANGSAESAKRPNQRKKNKKLTGLILVTPPFPRG